MRLNTEHAKQIRSGISWARYDRDEMGLTHPATHRAPGETRLEWKAYKHEWPMADIRITRRKARNKAKVLKPILDNLRAAYEGSIEQHLTPGRTLWTAQPAGPVVTYKRADDPTIQPGDIAIWGYSSKAPVGRVEFAGIGRDRIYVDGEPSWWMKLHQRSIRIPAWEPRHPDACEAYKFNGHYGRGCWECGMYIWQHTHTHMAQGERFRHVWLSQKRADMLRRHYEYPMMDHQGEWIG